MIARRSQKIEHGAIVCDHDRRIAEMEICSLRNERAVVCEMKICSLRNEHISYLAESTRIF